MESTIPIVEIDGLGRVEVDPSFLRKTPEEQQAIIEEIAAQAKPDFARIKRNIAKMIDQGAPETDIDAYLQEEGVTAAQLRKHRGAARNVTVTFADGTLHLYRNVPSSMTPEQVTERAEREFGKDVTHLDGGRGGSSSAPNRNSPETSKVLARLVKQLYPHAQITSGKRSAEHNAEVGGVPNSSHVSGHGLDVVGLSPAERADLKRKMEAAGIRFDEFKYHDAGSGMHLHMASTHVPADLLSPHSEPDESAASAPREHEPARPASTGNQHSVPVKPQEPQEGFLEGIGHSLGDFANGVGEGWNGFQNDLTGLLLRGTDAIGLTEGSLDRFDRIKKEVADPYQASQYHHPDGWSRTVGYGVGNLVASAPLAEIKPLQALGATGRAGKLGDLALQGGLFGTVASRGHDIPEHAAVGAVAAPVLGTAAEKAIGLTATHVANPILDRLAPKLQQERFARSQAGNPYVKEDAQVAADLEKLVQVMAVNQAKGKLRKAQQQTLLSRVNDLERSYLPTDEIKGLDLPPSVKKRLQAAIAKRHLMSDAEVQALRDGTPAGEAVAEAVTKARRLRAYVPEASGSPKDGVNRLLTETVGNTIGWKLGGPIGGMVGTAAGRTLSREGGIPAARAALELAAKAPKFANIPEVITAKEAGSASNDLARLAAETLDAPYHTGQAAQAEAERLASEGSKVTVQNAKDDIRPSGGWRGLIYERTGLLPSQQDAGVLSALKDGKLTPAQFDHFLNSPEKLMEGNAGNALTDRLAAMADEGRLVRDPKWAPPQATDAAPMVDTQGKPIRSLEAYRAGAAKNTARELPILQELDAINVERSMKYDSDPDYARIAGTAADPYVSRVKALQSTLERMRGSGVAK